MNFLKASKYCLWVSDWKSVTISQLCQKMKSGNISVLEKIFPHFEKSFFLFITWYSSVGTGVFASIPFC